MSDLTIDTDKVAPVEILAQFTRPAVAWTYAGVWVYESAAGTLVAATNTVYGERHGMALRASVPNGAITVIEEGIVDVGDALANLAIGAEVYLSTNAGLLATTGTVQVGDVTAGLASTTADKLLHIKKEF